jgi:Ca2+-binding EF-hand superfamily protein
MKIPILLAACLAAALPAQEAAVKAADAFIRKHDMNGDYRLRFEEFKDAEAFKKQDRNRDGQITVADFIPSAAPSNEDRMMMMADRALYRYEGFQTIPKFDFNRNAVLEEHELVFLLITVIDYDEDRVLNAYEIKRSRIPPGLALEEGWFQKDAKAFDQNADTVIVTSEMRVPDVVLRSLDKNKDGKVSLEEIARAQVAVIGGYLARFHELSDLVGKLGKLDKANWAGDPDLFHKLDADGDSSVSAAEFDRYARALKTTISMCPDFLTRHDVDGDLKVSRREFPGTDSMFARMDRNKDGVVTPTDR